MVTNDPVTKISRAYRVIAPWNDCYHYSSETTTDIVLDLLPMSSEHLADFSNYSYQNVLRSSIVEIAPESIAVSIKSLPIFFLISIGHFWM